MNDENKNRFINGQLELFSSVNSSLDDVDHDPTDDDNNYDPHDDPFNPNYRSKVVCPIDDKYYPKKDS